MNQSLYLLRHAKAQPWQPGVNDFQRCLSQRGDDHMLRLADWMSKNLSAPEAVLCSSSQRTRETLSPILGVWPELQEITIYLDQIYEATTGTLYALMEQAFETSDSILMVGHNPAFEYLALELMNDFDAEDINKMATGTLAVIDFPHGYEQDAGHGVLRQWIRRKNLQDS